MTEEEIEAVERLANKKVRNAIALDEHRNVPIAEAKAMGAMALFGERYGEEVALSNTATLLSSAEAMCPKTAGNIGIIKIVSEGSIAAYLTHRGNNWRKCGKRNPRVAEHDKLCPKFFGYKKGCQENNL